MNTVHPKRKTFRRRSNAIKLFSPTRTLLARSNTFTNVYDTPRRHCSGGWIKIDFCFLRGIVAFKKEIDAIHNQYQIVVKLALPENLEELKSKVNENNVNWKILKYYRGAVKMQTKKDRTKLEKTHIAKMNTEKGMVQHYYN